MKVIKVGIYVFLAYSLLVVGLYFFQEKIIFQGSSLPDSFQFKIDKPFEEVYLNTSDSSRIHGVLIRSDSSIGCILYFHGNRDDIVRWGNLAAYFTQYNYDVLVMDYRGYGKSKGKRTEELLHSDARLAYDYLLKQYDPENIILYGRSLGTGLATRLASVVRAKSLILETPYHNFRDMMNERFMILPTKKLFKYSFSSNEYISKINFPIYIFHGTNDSVIPIEYGIRLAESANTELTSFFTIEGGEHNNLSEFSDYNDAMVQVLK